MDLPGYDAWKLATPPEYEREESEAPDGAEIPNHRCANSACWICGACPICGDKHGAFCEVIKETLEPEEDIKW